MAIEGNKPAIWQIAAGPCDRSYADLFLDHDLALIGPGDAGPWSPERYDGNSEGRFIRKFATELHKGDVLLLRAGQSAIRAVGLVACKYRWLLQFDDVNGWDLQHGQRVRWCRLPEPHNFETAVFGAQPSRLSRVYEATAVDYANRFVESLPPDWQNRPLLDLPPEEKELEANAVPSELRKIVDQVQEFYRNVEAFGEWPTEDELVAHNVVPFLRALGWPAARIAVKWRRIDVCVFSEMRRIPEHCQYLIEAKRPGVGIEGALDQAKGYVSALGVQRDVVVTDGIRYRMYEASKDFAPVAYANLERLKQSSLELFKRMKKP